MTADPALIAIRLRAHRAMNPPEHQAWTRAAKRVIYPDGTVDLSRGVNAIPDDAAPALDLEQSAATSGSAFETAAEQVAAANGAYMPGGTDVALADGGTGSSTAAGARTNLGLIIGTDVPPVASPTFTGTLTTAGLTATGDTTLGNGDADVAIVQGHLKHKSAAPSIATGVALGTGGSVGTTVNYGTDQAGKVTLTAGTASLTTGVAATITLATARPNTSYALVIGPVSLSAPLVNAYAVVTATNTWDIRFQTAPTSGTAYSFCYWIVEVSN